MDETFETIRETLVEEFKNDDFLLNQTKQLFNQFTYFQFAVRKHDAH